MYTIKVFFVLFVCLISQNLLAQDIDSLESRAAIPVDFEQKNSGKSVAFSWGLRAGFSKTRMNTISGDVTQITASGTPVISDKGVVRNELVSNTAFGNGFQGALFVRFLKEPLYLQPELIYAMKGGKFDFLDQEGNLLSRVDAKFSAIDLPILLGINFKKARIFGGPVISYALNKNSSFSEALSPYTNEDLEEGFFNRPTVNALLGIGFEFNSFFFDLRYEGGIGHYGQTTLGPVNNPRTFTFTNDQFIFSIGFIN